MNSSMRPVARYRPTVIGVALGMLLSVVAQAVLAGNPATPVFVHTDVISVAAPAYTLSYTAAASQVLSVTLTDLALVSGPNNGSSGLTPLTSVNLVVTANGAIVNASPGGAPATLSAPGTVSFAGVANTVYEVFVVGVPSAGASSANAISVQIAAQSNGAQLAFGTHSFPNSTTLAPPPVYFAPTDFNVTTAGTYNVTLADQVFPAALNTLKAFVQPQTPSASCAKTGLVAGGTTPVALDACPYQIYVYAVADQTALAGLFGVSIAPGGNGAALLNTSIAVGLAHAAANGSVTNATAQSLVLKATDLKAPSALGSLAAAVTNGATLLGTATNGTPATFAAPAATLQIWQLATPATGSAGAYTITLATTTGKALYPPSSPIPVPSVVADPASNLYPYGVYFASSGSYTVQLTDLQFPAGLNSLSYSLYQDGAQVATGPAAASIPPVTVQSGPGVLIANAVPPTAGSTAGDGVYACRSRQRDRAQRLFRRSSPSART